MLFKNRLTIIMYHGIVKSPLKIYDWCFTDELSFLKQIEYLKRHFEIMHLSDAVERLRNGTIRRPAAVITFDDGYQNNFDVAFPILRRERIPATIFLNTGLINTNDTVWFCRVNLALSKTNRSSIEWNGFKFDLSTVALKGRASAAIQGSLKELPHSELLATLRKFILELDVDPDCSMEIGSPFRMLSENAIREMVSSELIEFGAHTHNHTILSRLSEEERRKEIRRSIHAIRELTGRQCKYFAYPNGGMQDYDIHAINDLKACGIQIAVTTIAGPNGTMTPTTELRRYGIGADLPMAKFQLMVHHCNPKVYRVIR
jgi:peptidoglycan/xylan/chitin deacetylase (PgdA/CDA1 family)